MLLGAAAAGLLMSQSASAASSLPARASSPVSQAEGQSEAFPPGLGPVLFVFLAVALVAFLPGFGDGDSDGVPTSP